MRKKLFAVLALAILLAFCMAQTAWAEVVNYAVTGGNIQFDTETGAVTDVDGVITVVNIPAIIEGVPVIKIGDHAFENCKGLTSVAMPTSITYIGLQAFYGCNSLTNITIPNNVTSIGNYAFSSCKGLTSIRIPNSVTSVGRGTFWSCGSLTSVIIPNGVTFIGEWAFGDCSSLTSVTIPDSVTTIGDHAFKGCSGLTNVTISDSATSIGVGAFWDCSSLTSVTIPDSVTTIGDHAFEGCSGLTNVTISDSATSIGVGAFWDCSSLTSVTIPDSVTTIGDHAFEGCSGLTSVNIPNSITYIGWQAFGACSGLKDVYYKGTKEQWQQIEVDPSGDYYLERANIHFEDKPTYGDFRIAANTASTCLSKGTTTDMYIGYYKNDKLDTSTKEYVYTLSDNNILSVVPIGWSDTDGQQLKLIAKEPGECVLTITNPKNGESSRLELRVVDGAAGYAFDMVPKQTIEEGKTTNFYNHKGMVIDDFNYEPIKNASGNINKYKVTMTVYNTLNMYGAATSYDKDGNIYEFDVIDKFEPQSTSLTDNIVELINRTGDLFHQIGNEQYYSGEGISKETNVELTVPAGGYVQISNDVSSAVAVVANIYGLMMENTLVVTDLFSDTNELLKCEDEIVGDLLKNIFSFNRITKTTEDYIKEKAAEELAHANWDFDNCGENIQLFVNNLGRYGINMAENLSKEIVSVTGVLNITESIVQSAIPTGKLIDFLYDIVKFENLMIFYKDCMINFQSSDSINIYAPVVNNQYNSNGVDVSSSGQMDMEAVIHAYRVIDSDEIEIDETTFANDKIFENGMYETYSITMFKNGKEVQPDAPVTVRIPISDKFANSIQANLRVYRHNADGSLTDMNAHIMNGYAVFTTDHFSYYSVVDDSPVNNIYTITFDTDGGYLVGVTSPVKVGWGEKYTMPNANKTNYTLKHWQNKADKTKTYAAGGSYIISADTNLLAIWEYTGGSSSGGGHRRPVKLEEVKPEQPKPNEQPDIEITAENINTIFRDVMPDSWYAKAVAYVYNKGMMNGTTAGIFEPNATTTRAQIVTVLYRLEGEPATGTSKFGDVGANQYYTKAVAWAAANGIVNGYSDKEFAPDDNVTREQLAAILFRYAKFKGYDVTVKGVLSSFSDNGRISDWAVEAMQWSVGIELLNGNTDGTLAAGSTATRAEVAMMFMRFVENIAK